MEENKNEIKEIIDELKDEFEKLIMSNPYLFGILCKDKVKITFKDNKNKHIEYDYDPNKFIVYDHYKRLMFFIVGFICCCLIMAVTVIIFNRFPDLIPSILKEKSQTVSSSILNAMPIIITIFSLLIGFWALFLRAITKDFFTDKIIIAIIFYLVVGIITAYASRFSQEVILFICPLLGCIVLLSSLIFIYNPLSSKVLNDTIIKQVELIRNKLNCINTTMVQQSYLDIHRQIEEVEKSVHNKNTDALLKIQSLTVLDSLRLELMIQNSINSIDGINLVEDWKYLDSSQKMLEEIMTCEDEEITILGDLSFLSTEEGVEKLVKAICDKNKTFYIYFTGKVSPRGRDIIESPHCQNLVHNIKKKYSSEKEILDIIKAHVLLYPILSKSFTGIGFIGLRENTSGTPFIRYKKVYAYVSSHLMVNKDPEKDIDITRSNPFVFSWGAKKLIILVSLYMMNH